jgi:hypothetical protein
VTSEDRETAVETSGIAGKSKGRALDERADGVERRIYVLESKTRVLEKSIPVL